MVIVSAGDQRNPVVQLEVLRGFAVGAELAALPLLDQLEDLGGDLADVDPPAVILAPRRCVHPRSKGGLPALDRRRR